MRIRTSESYWLLKNGLLYSYPSLQEDLQTELIVVGGGITGALVSHALMDEGYDVVLLDKRDIGQGSTAATTSMLQYEIDVPLFELASMMGEEGAVTCYSAGIEAIASLAKLVKDLNIVCEFELKRSLYRAHNQRAAAKLRKEFEIRDKYKLDVAWLTPEAVMKDYGLVSSGGILSAHAASMDAYKMAHELIHYNAGRGMKVFDQTKIASMELNAAIPSITTDTNHKVTCKKLIFCSGFETTTMLKEKVAKLFYTYASVSERGIKIPDTLHNTVFWDTETPYFYMRTTRDRRLLIGGEDAGDSSSCSQDTIKEKKSVKLMNKLAKIFPGVDFIEDFNWGGTFGETKDGLPYIGKSPEYDNALFVLGFGGNGITFSAQAMEIIPALLKGKEHPLAPYYQFGR